VVNVGDKDVAKVVDVMIVMVVAVMAAAMMTFTVMLGEGERSDGDRKRQTDD
jgi:flagellar basal body-associated protein FliL